MWRSRNTKWYYCFILHSEKALFEGFFENLIVEISCDEVAAVRLENGVLFEIARAALLWAPGSPYPAHPGELLMLAALQFEHL